MRKGVTTGADVTSGGTSSNSQGAKVWGPGTKGVLWRDAKERTMEFARVRLYITTARRFSSTICSRTGNCVPFPINEIYAIAYKA